jgi:hypothetical protein
MKMGSMVAFFVSMAIAFALSDLPVILRWVCSSVFILTIIGMFLKKNAMDNVDEREMHIEHVAGWVSGIITLLMINIFIISDVLKGGHFDNRLFALISVWVASKAIVAVAMGGGRGKIN